VGLAAEVAVEVHAVKVVREELVVEVVLLTKVAPWVRQDFCLPITAHVSELDVIFQVFCIVEFLFSDEYQSSFEANLAERLLMIHFQMSFQRLQIMKLVCVVAIFH
jgi:hypothetical protein